jgi:hypothetical protein
VRDNSLFGARQKSASCAGNLRLFIAIEISEGKLSRQNRQFSLYFSLLAGISAWRAVRSRLDPPPLHGAAARVTLALAWLQI